jgi:hypothetical protein
MRNFYRSAAIVVGLASLNALPQPGHVSDFFIGVGATLVGGLFAWVIIDLYQE